MKFSRVEQSKQLILDKKKNGCEECGWNVHPAGLHLDHIDPDTKLVSKTGRRVNPGSMVNYSHAIIRAELAKCRVLCANCHAVHTYHQMAEMRSLGLVKPRGANRFSMSEVSDRLVA